MRRDGAAEHITHHYAGSRGYSAVQPDCFSGAHWVGRRMNATQRSDHAGCWNVEGLHVVVHAHQHIANLRVRDREGCWPFISGVCELEDRAQTFDILQTDRIDATS